MEAEITLEYDDARAAKSIARAISPDNLKTPRGLKVKTLHSDKRIVTKIECKDKLPTFIATIDDLLFCTSTAEKTVQTAKEME